MTAKEPATSDFESSGQGNADSGAPFGFTVNSIVRDEDSPDMVRADITLDMPHPCTYIRLILTV